MKITLNDAVAAIRFVLQRDSLDGPINVTSPEPATNLILAPNCGFLANWLEFTPSIPSSRK